jgi:hypothetical protein
VGSEEPTLYDSENRSFSYIEYVKRANQYVPNGS